MSFGGVVATGFVVGRGDAVSGASGAAAHACMPRKTRGESFVTSLGIVGRGEAAASELGAAAHACTPRKTRGESCVTSFGDSKSGVLTDSAARGGVRGDGLPTQLIALRASVVRPDDDQVENVSSETNKR